MNEAVVTRVLLAIGITALAFIIAMVVFAILKRARAAIVFGVVTLALVIGLFIYIAALRTRYPSFSMLFARLSGEGMDSFVSEMESMRNEPDTVPSFSRDELTENIRQYVAKNGFVGWNEDVYLTALANHLADKISFLPAEDDFVRCFKETIPICKESQAQEAARKIRDILSPLLAIESETLSS